MLKRMTLHISTGDGVVGYGAVYLYWGRCGRIPDCRYLLGTVQLNMVLWISTEDGVVGYVALDLYWGRCSRKWGDRSLLGTEW